jgi:hypothetical protein
VTTVAEQLLAYLLGWDYSDPHITMVDLGLFPFVLIRAVFSLTKRVGKEIIFAPPVVLKNISYDISILQHWLGLNLYLVGNAVKHTGQLNMLPTILCSFGAYWYLFEGQTKTLFRCILSSSPGSNLMIKHKYRVTSIYFEGKLKRQHCLDS